MKVLMFAIWDTVVSGDVEFYHVKRGLEDFT